MVSSHHVSLFADAENRPDDGLVRDEALDRRLLQDLESKENSPRFQKMMEFRKKLPSYEMREVSSLSTFSM